MNMIQYPFEVLPRADWKSRIDTCDIIKSCPVALLGHVLRNVSKDACFDYSLGEDRPQITMKALPVERIPNLSCSLLGTFFKPEHFAFLPDSQGAAPWSDSDGSQQTLLSDNNNFQPVENRTVVAWNLKEVHNRSIPYTRDVDFKMYSEIKSKIASKNGSEMGNVCIEEWDKLKQSTIPKNRLLPLDGRAQVNHDPLCLNYWHFTIDLYPPDNIQQIKDTGKKWKYDMALVLREYLKFHFVMVEEDTIIPQINDKSLWEKTTISHESQPHC